MKNKELMDDELQEVTGGMFIRNNIEKFNEEAMLGNEADERALIRDNRIDNINEDKGMRFTPIATPIRISSKMLFINRIRNKKKNNGIKAFDDKKII